MDNEGELMPPKAFDFFEQVSHYNPKDSPSNGYEYLYQVVNEAAKTPQTLVADINTDRFKKNQTIYIEEKVSSESPVDFIPSEEWQKLQLRNFEKVKRDITQKRVIWDKKEDSEKAKYLPRDRHPDNWLKFCNMSLPLLRTILSISQPDLDLLLEYHVQWLEKGKIEFCQRTNIWLFSILACLEEPLLPNTCANLRCVIRAAKDKRSTLSSSHDELLLPLNILICIAAKFFRQSDLVFTTDSLDVTKNDKKNIGRKWRKHLLSVNYPNVGRDTEEETILKTFFQDSNERKYLIKWVALELKYITDVAATLDHVGDALCCHGMLDEEIKDEFLYAKCSQEEQEETWRLIFAMLRFSKFTPEIEPLEIEEKCLSMYEDLNMKFLDLCSKGRKTSGVNLPTGSDASKENEKSSEAFDKTEAIQSTEGDCERLRNSSETKQPESCSSFTKIEKDASQFNMMESKSRASYEKSLKHNYVRYRGMKVDADNLPFVYIPRGAPLSLDSIDSKNLRVKVKTIPRKINEEDVKELHKAQDILKSLVRVLKANMEAAENNINEEKLDDSPFSLHNSLTRYNRLLDKTDEGVSVTALENIEPSHLSLETMSNIHSMYQEKKCHVEESLGQESEINNCSEEQNLP